MEQGLPSPRRRKRQIAPWERALRRYWPMARLLLIAAILLGLAVLVISVAIRVIL